MIVGVIKLESKHSDPYVDAGSLTVRSDVGRLGVFG